MKKIFFVIVIFFTLANSASAAAIAPARFDEMIFPPGVEIREKLTIYNDSKKDAVFIFEVKNFTALDDKGTPKFLENLGGLRSWISFPENEAVVASGEEKVVPFTISVPENAEAGGYYAAIFAVLKIPAGEGRIEQTSKIGALILGQVPGQLQYKASLLDFKIGGHDVRLFYSVKPKSFSAIFKNNGNVHFRPEVQVNIKSFFGLNKEYVDMNSGDGYLLPESERNFSGNWRKAGKIEGFFGKLKTEIKEFAFGRYSAELVFKNSGETQISKKIVFWIIPYHIVIVVIVIVALILAIRLKLKKHNS